MNSDNHTQFAAEEIKGLVEKHARERHITPPGFTCPKEICDKIGEIGMDPLSR